MDALSRLLFLLELQLDLLDMLHPPLSSVRLMLRLKLKPMLSTMEPMDTMPTHMLHMLHTLLLLMLITHLDITISVDMLDTHTATHMLLPLLEQLLPQPQLLLPQLSRPQPRP